MSDPVKFPGATGRRFTLSVTSAVVDPPQDEPFRIGDVFTMGPFSYRFRVTAIDGDNITFERIS